MVKSSVFGFFYGKSSKLEGVLWENHQTNWWTNWCISMVSIDVHFSSFSLWFFTTIPWFRIRPGPPWGPLGSPPAAGQARSRCGPGRPRPGWKRSGCRCYAPRRRRSRAPGDRWGRTGTVTPVTRGENEKTTGRPMGVYGFDDVGKMSLFRIGIILDFMGVMWDYHGKDAGINLDTFASIQFSHNLPKDQKGSKSESKLMMNYLSFFLDGTIYIHYYIYIMGYDGIFMGICWAITRKPTNIEDSMEWRENLTLKPCSLPWNKGSSCKLSHDPARGNRCFPRKISWRIFPQITALEAS